jgi:hypothetical protein
MTTEAAFTPSAAFFVDQALDRVHSIRAHEDKSESARRCDIPAPVSRPRAEQSLKSVGAAKWQ